MVSYLFGMRKINIVTSTGHRKWAIGELARNLSTLLSEFNPRIVEIPQSRRQSKSLAGWAYFPRAMTSIFMQQDLLLYAIQRKWIAKTNFVILRYTHNNQSLSNYREALTLSKTILVENSQTKLEMMEMGIEESRIKFLPHPIEWHKFKSTKSVSKKRDVIFVSNYYIRKRPDLILETIKALPELTFTVYGKNWEKWTKFHELIKLRNINYLEFDYSDYPSVLAQHKVFCSLSDMEGGPVPLLESLTAGLVPVVTDTGYARDLMSLTQNIYIIPVAPEIDLVKKSLKLALLAPSVCVNTSQFDLNSYASFIRQIIQPHIP